MPVLKSTILHVCYAHEANCNESLDQPMLLAIRHCLLDVAPHTKERKNNNLQWTSSTEIVCMHIEMQIMMQTRVVVHLSSDFICSGVNQPERTSCSSSLLLSMILVTEHTNCSYKKTKEDLNGRRNISKHDNCNTVFDITLSMQIYHKLPPYTQSIPNPCQSQTFREVLSVRRGLLLLPSISYEWTLAHCICHWV